MAYLKGITIEIDGSTRKLEAALGSVRKAASALTRDLKDINKNLNVDPRNVELIAQKYQTLNQAIGTAKEKLTTLKNAQEQVKAAFDKGEITLQQFNNFKREIISTEQEIRKLTNEANNFKTNYERAFSGINTETKKLKDELGQIDKALKIDPRNIDLITQKQKVLSQTIALTRQKLLEMQQVYNRMAREMNKGLQGEAQFRKLQREIQNTKKELKSMESEARNANKTMRSLDYGANKITEFGEKLKDLGTKWTARVTTPIVTGLKAATQAALEFESAVAGIAKTYGDQMSDMELDKLAEDIREMSKTLPMAATEIAGIAEVAGQLGVAKEHLLDFTKVMINLGVSTNLSSQEAAIALSQFANITQMPIENIDRLGASIVDLGNHFETFESDIVEMGMRIAGAGHQVGMTEAEIMALSATLNALGIKAEMGGSAISRVITRIDKAVASGGKQLQQFAQIAGVSAEEFAKHWRESPARALAEFLKGLNRASKAGKNMNLILDALKIKGIREMDVIKRTAHAHEELAKALDMSAKAYEENTALVEETERRYQTTESKLIMAKNAIDDAFRSLGAAIAPAVIKIANALASLADKFTKLPEPVQETIGILLIVTAALGPLSIILGSIVKNVGLLGRGIIELHGKSILLQKLTTPFKNIQLGANLSASALKALIVQYGLLVAAVGAAVLAIKHMAKEANKVIDEMNKSLTEESETIDKLVEKYKETKDEKYKNMAIQLANQQIRDNKQHSYDRSNNALYKGLESIFNKIDKTMRKPTENKNNDPNTKQQKESNINININNPVVQKKADVNEIMREIEDQIKRRKRAMGTT